jgi:hypothetical protein
MPANGAIRTEAFNAGLNAITQNAGDLGIGAYKTPGYVDPGAYKGAAAPERMAAGDYDRLERNLLASQTAGLDRAKSLDVASTDANLAKRGIWSSGLAERAQGDNNERYAAQYLKAGADAASGRYGLQQADIAGANQFTLADNANRNAYSLNAASTLNSFNKDTADKQYTAQWQPLNFLKDLWGGTAGQVGIGSSDSWNANLSGSYGKMS